MALPVNSTPVYTLTVPSTKQEIKYRPFLVKEEKALLTAQQSEDSLVMLDTIKEVIKSCSKTDFDVNKLASFDIEYIFMKLRAVSVGEIVDLVFQCDVDHGEDNEKAQATVRLDLNTVNVEFSDGHTNKIPLFDDVGLVMKYPTADTLKNLSMDNLQDLDQAFKVVVECIEYVYSGDEMFSAKEQSKEELTEFLNNLSSDQFLRVQKFFDTMPKLRAYVNYTCPVCGKEHNKYLEGLQSFF